MEESLSEGIKFKISLLEQAKGVHINGQLGQWKTLATTRRKNYFTPDEESYINIGDIFIHNDMIDAYLLHKRGQVPKHYSDPITEREDYDTKTKLNAKFY